LWRTSPPSTTT
jgi:hypothetical protein